MPDSYNCHHSQSSVEATCFTEIKSKCVGFGTITIKIKVLLKYYFKAH